MVPCWKIVDCPLRMGGELLLQANLFKYIWVLFTSDGKVKQEMDRRFGPADAALDRHIEEEAEPKGEALDLPVHLHSDPHLWPRAVGSDQKGRYK